MRFVRDRAFRPLVVTLLATILAAPSPARGQSAGWAVAASAAAGLFVGDGSDFLDGGFGVDLSASRALVGALRVRTDGMLALMAEQTDPFESADNRILVLGIGPEVGVRFGPLGLHARALVGRAAAIQMRTRSALEERTTWASAVGAGAAVRLRIAPDLHLDAGGDVVDLGTLDFARTASSSLALQEDPTLLRLHAGLFWVIG